MSIEQTTIRLAGVEDQLIHGESIMRRQRWLIAANERRGADSTKQSRILARLVCSCISGG